MPEYLRRTVELSPLELRERSDELANVCAEKERVLDEKKKAGAALAAEAKELDKRIRDLSRTVLTKKEARDLEVSYDFDLFARVRKTYRADTGEELVDQRRSMSDRELDERQQGTLQFNGNVETEKPKGDAAAGDVQMPDDGAGDPLVEKDADAGREAELAQLENATAPEADAPTRRKSRKPAKASVK